MAITDELFSTLQDGQIGRIGEQLGISQAQAQSAVAAALPLLVGALGRNAQHPQGASSLFEALGKDHAGIEPASALASSLGGGGQGDSILGHIFGRRQGNAAGGLGAATGLGNERAGALLRLLAPVVMAYLAKKMYDRRHAGDGVAGAPAPGASTRATPIPDAASTPSPGGLASMLGRENVHIAQQGGIGSKLLSAVLDRDHDGDVDFSDLAGAAMIAASAIGAARRL
jgi:hypothetical protein